MRDVRWPVGLLVGIAIGAAAGGWLGRGPLAGAELERLREERQRLRAEVTSLRERLGDELDEPLGAGDPGDGSARSRRTSGNGTARSGGASPSAATVEAWARHVLREREAIRGGGVAEAAGTARRASAEVALDRFYHYLEALSTAGGLTRWQRMQETADELRRMGPPAVEALMRVLSSGASTDERRAAAQLLGELEASAAVPLLQEIAEREGDLALRRATVSSLRRIESPETVPILESLLLNPDEDRYIRSTAANGLAQMERSQGVAALMQVFDESSVDKRGRDLAFRAIASLGDERALPFMRRLAASDTDMRYRVRAIRFLSTQIDRQALPMLAQIMESPTEPAPVKSAAAQAHASISERSP